MLLGGQMSVEPEDGARRLIAEQPVSATNARQVFQVPNSFVDTFRRGEVPR